MRTSITIGQNIKVLTRTHTRELCNKKIDVLYIHKDVEVIGWGAFNECRYIKKICFQAYSNCHTIEGFAFDKNFSLETIVLPLSLKYIKERAFSFCVMLKNIIVPMSVCSISKNAFLFCVNLQKVHIKNTKTQIQPKVFNATAKMQYFVWGDDKYQVLTVHSNIALFRRTKTFQDKYFCRGQVLQEVVDGKIHGEHLYFMWETNHWEHCGYGKNLHEALHELEFQKNSDTWVKDIGPLTEDTVLTVEQYRHLTGDCKYGVEEFLNEHNIDKETAMSIKDIYALANGEGSAHLFGRILNKGVSE